MPLLYPAPYFQHLSWPFAPAIRHIRYCRRDTLTIETDRGVHLYKQSTHAILPVFELEDSNKLSPIFTMMSSNSPMMNSGLRQ